MSSSPPTLRRPGGARPAPPRLGIPAKLDIPEGNVPGINVEQAGEGGWHQPALELPPIHHTLPALARMPRSSPLSGSGSASSRPKLSLSANPSPSASPALTASVPLLRPTPLGGRSGTPSLKLSIPGMGGTPGGSGGSAYASGHDYPSDPADDDSLDSALRTPTAAGREDRNPTLQARGADYDGEGESSYGYGRLGNGLSLGAGDQMSAMTEDIRQALSRTSSRFDGGSVSSPFGGIASTSSSRSRSRANSTAGSIASTQNGSRRGSAAGIDDLSALRGLSLCEGDEEVGRRDSTGSASGGEEAGSPTFDPAQLVTLKRLGEGTGGAVELVQDRKSGRIMAKKVSLCRS